MRRGPAGRRLAALALLLVVLAATLVPIAAVVRIIATTGANNLSNDYLAYAGIVDQVFGGTYNWLNYFHDTFYRTHSVAVPMLLHLACARLFDWNAYAELYLGVALACGRLLLLHQTLSTDLVRPVRWALWPLLAALLFSMSQISLFVYGDTALTIGTALFGFALGLYGLVRLQNSRLGAFLMLTGGLIASFSWANGLVSWFVFLLGLILLGYRGRWIYLLWLGGLSVSLIPYLSSLVLERLSASAPSLSGTTPISLFNHEFIINTLGWPFASGIGQQTLTAPASRTAGWTGIALLASGLALLARRRELWRPAAPALLLIAHGLLSVWQISIFRNLIASWYTPLAMTFWIGLLGLACLFISTWKEERSQPRPPGSLSPLVPAIWGVLALAFLATAYAASNRNYEDKTDLLFSRSPASEAAMRNYRTAPTYAEGLIFQWGVGNPDLLPHLAAPLERYSLSAFAPHQVWTLQGDYLLDTVTVHQPDTGTGIFWTTGRSPAERLPWSHYKHLNLAVPAPGSVAWTVTLPPDAEEATFRTALASAENGQGGAARQPVLAQITVSAADDSQRQRFVWPLSAANKDWRAVSIPLTQYAGNTITILLKAQGKHKEEPGSAVFRFPEIELKRTRPKPPPGLVTVTPSNTDRSGRLPSMSPADFTAATRGGTTPGLRLSDYSHVWFAAAAPETIMPRVVSITLAIEGRDSPIVRDIPLLKDGEKHNYVYDLKLLDLPADARLTALGCKPSPAAGLGSQDIVISDLRLIRRPHHNESR